MLSLRLKAGWMGALRGGARHMVAACLRRTRMKIDSDDEDKSARPPARSAAEHAPGASHVIRAVPGGRGEPTELMVQICQWRRCGSGEPSPGVDVAGASPVPV